MHILNAQIAIKNFRCLAIWDHIAQYKISNSSYLLHIPLKTCCPGGPLYITFCQLFQVFNGPCFQGLFMQPFIQATQADALAETGSDSPVVGGSSNGS